MSIDARLQSYGKVFGDWTIREQIGHGSGGKSAVFLLKRKNLTYEETCVMKVISILEQRGNYREVTESLRSAYEETSRQRAQAAENEVSLMYGLRGSGNIVSYLDYRFERWDDGISFGVDLLIRMDYLNSLGNLMRSRRLTEGEILKIGKDICNALMSCHARNIIHRDIKPDNIFYNQYGSFLLGDFGISKMMENSQSTETRTGTEPYAAPEQFAGGYDGRVDIYSLGLTLYQLANGNKLPFADSEFVKPADIRMRLSGKEIPGPGYVGAALAKVLKKACAFRREDRYQTAEEFRAALDAIPVKEETVPEAGTQSKTRADLFATRPTLHGEAFERSVEEETSDYTTRPSMQAAAPEHFSEEARKTGFRKGAFQKETLETRPALRTEEPEEFRPEPSIPFLQEPEKDPGETIPDPGERKAPFPDEVWEQRSAEASELTVDVVAVGREYYENGDFEKAADWFKKGVSAGSTEALYELAMCYMNGNGVPREEETAINLFLNCVRKEPDNWKRALAKFRIGQIYEGGYGGKKGRKEAEKWFRESAAEGNPYAMKKFRNGKLAK